MPLRVVARRKYRETRSEPDLRDAGFAFLGVAFINGGAIEIERERDLINPNFDFAIDRFRRRLGHRRRKPVY
jgi:hypothetical protein